MVLVVVRIMSDAGSDDLDEERVQDLGVRMCCSKIIFLQGGHRALKVLEQNCLFFQDLESP